MERRSAILLILLAAAAIAVSIALLIADDDATSTVPGSASPGQPTTTAPVPTPTDPATTEPSTGPETTVATTTTTIPPTTLPEGTTVCDQYESVDVAGSIASEDLVEASGMGASRTNPGVFWAHNDSRDGARIYAVESDGADLGAYDIAGALAFDWEDVAVGPGPDGIRPMVYIGDIGDNFSIRSGRITVYRVPEPDLEAIQGPIGGTVPLEYEYPDGAHDAEALFITDGSIYVATKDSEETRVYRGDAWGDGSTIETLQLVATLGLGAEVSAADVSWDGSTIALRGYRSVWMWHRAPGTTVADALATEPCNAPSPDEVQGESIAFLEDRSYATISEGSHPALNVVLPAS